MLLIGHFSVDEAQRLNDTQDVLFIRYAFVSHVKI